MPERRRFPVPEQQQQQGFFTTPATINDTSVTLIDEVRRQRPSSLLPVNLEPVLRRHMSGLEEDDYLAGDIDSADLIPVLKGYRREGVSIADLRQAVTSFAVNKGLDPDMAQVQAAAFAENIFQAGETHGIHLVQTHRVPEASSLNGYINGKMATRLPRPGRS